MTHHPTAAVENAEDEITVLVRALHETQGRLQELAGGEVDAVLHPGGHSYLLHEAQERLRQSEALQRTFATTQSSILNALPARVALLDEQGVIVSINDGWQQIAGGNALAGRPSMLGQNYVEVCERAEGNGAENARAAAAGIRAILSGASTTEFLLEYPCHSPTEQRWFLLRVNPIAKDGPGGAVVMHVNITENKQAADAVRESEQRFRSMFTAAATGIAISTPDGHFLQANAAYCQMLGYTEEELLTRDFASLTHPDDLAVNLELRDEMLAGQRESFVLEKRYRKKSGDIVWARQSVSAVRTAGGQIVRFIVIAEDTTEGRRMEAALRQSEARHRSLFENMIEGYCFCRLLYDEQGVARDYVYVEVNGAFAKQCGLRDVVGKKVSEIVPGMHETNPEQLERYSLVAATGQPERFETYVKPLGIWFSISVYSPEKGHFIAVFDNITERKRSEARFRRLVDSNIQGVLFWSRNGEITGANDTFLKLVHHTREDLEAGLVNWVALTPPEYADRDERCLREIEARGYGTPYEKEFLLEDGTRVPILLGSAAFEDNPKEGVCFVLDLTERKNLEQQFLRAQRMESIGTLAGGIAHDLNNSFGPIIMALDLLEMRFTDADSQKLIATVAASARHGASMVRQVLSFARGVEGERVEAQFLHLVREMEKIARDTFPRQIEVRTNVPNGLWTVLGDPTQLHQVLLNLCVNARDAMPDGGTLTISAENRVLDAQYAGLHVEAQPGPYLLLQVEDNGCGMPAAVMEKIFDPFFTTKEVGKGTGLGLSTTMSIVKSHGGFIRVHSELRKGTKFHVYLPAQTSPGAAGEEVAPELPRGHGELILVVDDEDSVRQITQQTLEAFGYRVVAACDGADAVATFARHRAEIAAVLTDMMMPLMDGPATIRALRKLNPRLPIVAASGLSAENHVAHAARLGINHFLGKPYTSAALLRALQQMLPAKTEDAPA